MPARFQPLRTPAASAAVGAHLGQASRLRQEGRFAESIAPMLAAARLEPGNAVIFHDLGLTFLETGQIPDAMSALKQAIRLKPDFAEAHWRLGVALERIGDTDTALRAHQAAVRIRPSLGEAQFRLAALLEGAGRRKEASDHFRRAKSTARDAGLRRIAEARACMLEGRDAEAQKVLRRAVALDPNDATALDLLGVVLAEAGAFEEAAVYYERALARAPSMVGCYYDLVRCGRVSPDSGLVERMSEALTLPGLGDEALVKVNLALGKAYDDLGQYDAAMAAFDTADEVRRQICGFDLAAFQREVDLEIRRFTPELVGRAKSVGNPDLTPVMVLGMPRSGTTLCEQILSSHPDVRAGEELLFWTRRGAMMQAAGDGAPTDGFIAEASSDYLAHIRAIAPSAGRITDKMPFNFLWAGLIHLSFPNATIFHCRRSPIDTALSIHQVFFSPRLNFPTGAQDLVTYYRLYERIMAHWRAVLPPDRFVEIDYETLIVDPEPQIRRMIAAAGLSWDDACLHPERNDRVVKTPSKWQAKQPINRGSVDRWRRYEPYVGPLAALISH